MVDVIINKFINSTYLCNFCNNVVKKISSISFEDLSCNEIYYIVSLCPDCYDKLIDKLEGVKNE